MTSFSTSVPAFTSLPSDSYLQPTHPSTKNLSMASNSPSRSTENDSPAPAHSKENDDDTLVDYNQVYKNLIENKQEPIKKQPSQSKSTNAKRMSKQDADYAPNVEVVSKKQRNTVAQYKEVTQAVEKSSKKVNKDSNKAPDNIKRLESPKDPLNNRNSGTKPADEKPEGSTAIIYDEEIQKKIKQCRKIRVGYSEESKQLNFTLDCLNQADMTTQTIELTRNQMLTYNPKLVLMFYEKNLQFPQMPDFNISDLKQV